MEKEKQVDTDSPLVTWLTPAIDSALAALTPPPSDFHLPAASWGTAYWVRSW